tara:strand:+ start:1040 stop:1228 length:189 start_codon:yes stop_codon:yes gene_type:complete
MQVRDRLGDNKRETGGTATEKTAITSQPENRSRAVLPGIITLSQISVFSVLLHPLLDRLFLH